MSSCGQGGTVRWMSPERLDPKTFGLKDSRPTKASDCYALGMVVYEVLSGHEPFYQHGVYVVPVKVFKGERPERPQEVEGRWFTDEIWEILERCWKSNPSDRPGINCVFECLGRAVKLWTPFPSPVVGPRVADSPTWAPLTPFNTGGSMAVIPSQPGY